jgi:hypothetical protein
LCGRHPDNDSGWSFQSTQRKHAHGEKEDEDEDEEDNSNHLFYSYILTVFFFCLCILLFLLLKQIPIVTVITVYGNEKGGLWASSSYIKEKMSLNMLLAFLNIINGNYVKCVTC